MLSLLGQLGASNLLQFALHNITFFQYLFGSASGGLQAQDQPLRVYLFMDRNIANVAVVDSS